MVKQIVTMVIAALTTMSAIAQLQQPYHWEVVKVVDGDTVEVRANWLPVELGDTILVRLRGIDAPETTWRAHCEEEKVKGRIATSALARLVLPSTEVIISNWDKYGGRIDGDLVNDGKLATNELLQQELVKPYSGAGPKPDWCN